MSISFLFTKSSKIGSRLIRWGLRESSSHFAVGFDLGPSGRGVIFHSNFHGLKIDWADDFLKHNTVVHRLVPVVELQLQAEERLFQAVVKNYGKPYDYNGFMFFIFSVLWKRICGKDVPRTNPWGDNKAFLCTEVAEEMRAEIHDIFQVLIPFTRGAISPTQLYTALAKSPLLAGSTYG